MDDREDLLQDARAVLEQALRTVNNGKDGQFPPFNQAQIINIGSINHGPVTIHELKLDVGK